MNLVGSVYEIAESFMKESEYVFMNEDKIQSVAEEMIKVGKPSFPVSPVENDFKAVLLELVAASVNYCYWYGKDNIRPNGASSTMMYELLQNAFFDYEDNYQKQTSSTGHTFAFENCITRYIELLAIRRFPLLEERERHLRQLVKLGESFTEGICNEHTTIEPHMINLVSTFSGFASDTFLKRASLFFIQLFRRFGWFESDLHTLHVPADYQVPKMLNHFGCLIYDDDLDDAILNNSLIPKHSQGECEIRAATILTIKKLCKITKWNVAEVDGYFFTKRHDSSDPFHLTITTDY